MRPKGSDVPFRCCIHKERAILRDRAIAGLGLSIEEADDSELLSTLAEKSQQRTEPEENPLTVRPSLSLSGNRKNYCTLRKRLPCRSNRKR